MAKPKLKRCPNGQRRNKVTGECEPINKAPKEIKQSSQAPKPKLKRCPNGQRRNKQTGECEPINKNLKPEQPTKQSTKQSKQQSKQQQHKQSKTHPTQEFEKMNMKQLRNFVKNNKMSQDVKARDKKTLISKILKELQKKVQQPKQIQKQVQKQVQQQVQKQVQQQVQQPKQVQQKQKQVQQQLQTQQQKQVQQPKQVQQKQKQVQQQLQTQQQKQKIRIQNQLKNLAEYEQIKQKEYQRVFIDDDNLKNTWSLVHVPMDNHCGFHAISLWLKMNDLKNWLTNDENENIETLRNYLINAYKEEKELKNSPLSMKDIDDRIDALTTSDTEWLSDDDMVIFSKLFKMCFYILRKDPKGGLGWSIISYEKPYMTNFIESSNICKKSPYNDNSIFMYNPSWTESSPGLHYDLLVQDIIIDRLVNTKFSNYSIRGPFDNDNIFHKDYYFEQQLSKKRKKQFLFQQSQSQSQQSQSQQSQSQYQFSPEYLWAKTPPQQIRKKFQQKFKQIGKKIPKLQQKKSQQTKIKMKTDDEIINFIESCFK
jgi:chemotaxis protein histidine kinase CheA